MPKATAHRFEDEVDYAQLKKELRQTQWHLNASQRVAGVGSWQIIMMDPDTTLPGSHQWSDEAYRMLGYEPGEIVVSNELFLSHVHPEDVTLVEAALWNSVVHRRPYDIEHRLIRKDGAEIVVHDRGDCEHHEDNKQCVKIIGTIQDITARRKAENYEASLKSIFDNTALAYILLDARLNIVAFNDAAYKNGVRLLDVKLEEGKSILSYVERNRRTAVSNRFNAVVNGRKYSYEECFQRRIGDHLWGRVNLFPVLLDRTKLMGMAITIEDITEQKRSADLIRAQKAKYRSFFMNSMNALLISRKDGPILEANPAACKLFGMTEQEICTAGRFGLVDVMHPNLLPILEERQRTGHAEGELIFLGKDGSRFPGILTSSVYTDAHGEERTSMSIYDISERKQAEESLEQNNKELRRLMDQLSTVREEERESIAREIHDELGQQLSTLRMGVHRVMKKLEAHHLSDDVTADLLGEIDQAIKSVRRIATNLRPIILEYEGLTPALKWYASEFEKLHGIPCDLIVSLPAEIEDKKIAITLFRVLQESFTNIIRHANAKHITVDITAEDDVIMLRVMDDGVGIDTEAASRKRTFGLVSMHERVAMVGGSFSIMARMHGGTITQVTVPYAFG